MNNLYTIIYNVYKEREITDFHFDCMKILNHYGYKVYTYSELKMISQELYDMCKICSNDAFLFKDKKLIAYNDEMPYYRIRFSLMHELGHILLNHKASSVKNEDEADYFASCILAPRIMIHHLKQTNKYSKVTADDIHEYFDISISASNRALMDYHNWYSEIARTTRKPTDTELAIKELFVEKPKPSKTRKRNVKRNSPVVRYLLDPSNDEYIVREMERRRTEPY